MNFSKSILRNNNFYINGNNKFICDIHLKKYLYTTRFLLNEQSEDEFRVLDLKRSTIRSRLPERKKNFEPQFTAPRENIMPVDQDWPSVWPGPRSFHPASVPLPIRQGYTQKGAPPDKYGNAELMKIPNFLHLTPPAIKRQCEALKKFCTPWPSELNTDEKCLEYFPIQVITSDYCHSAPTIRNPLSRIVTIKVKVSELNLDAHAKDKFLRIVGKRYKPEDDILTIVTDRCPLRIQNYDYAIYLITALYHESLKVEPWESEKTLDDMEYYDWNTNISKVSFDFLKNWLKNKCNIPEDQLPTHEKYKEAVENLLNQGEDEYTLNKYKESTLSLFSLSQNEKLIKL